MGGCQGKYSLICLANKVKEETEIGYNNQFLVFAKQSNAGEANDKGSVKQNWYPTGSEFKVKIAFILI